MLNCFASRWGLGPGRRTMLIKGIIRSLMFKGACFQEENGEGVMTWGMDCADAAQFLSDKVN